MPNVFDSRDTQLAWQLHNQLNSFDTIGVTENAHFSDVNLKQSYRPRTLIDNTLETIDPTPNIYTLFMQFNSRFFQKRLLSVEVKWSYRMTSCAGVCTFNTGSRYCVIALSSPLLKLRPRKDLVETLLHEMIHAYLFITNNNRDRSGHGPEFCKHMDRINKEAGTNITIYHTFHAEVKLYQQHWWRCNGPCQKKQPFFGMVRRSMNRAPGPNDFWWKEHQLTCGGQFIKVREPEKPEKAKTKSSKNDTKKPSIDKWLITSSDEKSNNKSGSNNVNKSKDKSKLKTNNNNKPETKTIFKPGGSSMKTKSGTSVLVVNKWNANNNSDEPKIKKLGNTTNNVHGFGTGGPSSGSSSSSSKPTISSGKHFAFSGTVGGSSTGQSRLIQIFSKTKSDSQSQPNIYNQMNLVTRDSKSPNKNTKNLKSTVQCPICKNLILEKIVNDHIDECLVLREETGKKSSFESSSPKFAPIKDDKEKLINKKDMINCPFCNKSIYDQFLMEHLDLCLIVRNEAKNPAKIEELNSSSETLSSPSLILIDEKPDTIVITDSDSEVDTPTRKRKNSDSFTFKEPKVPKNDDKIVNCPVCGKEMKIDYINHHLDDCLATIGDDIDRNEAGTAVKNDQIENRDQIEKNDMEKVPETCLICNEILNPEIPLAQHLDDCLRNMFNDDSDDSTEINSEENGGINLLKSKTVTESMDVSEFEKSEKRRNESCNSEISSNQNNKYPCPVCMNRVSDKDMNDHLNVCLQ